MAIPTFDIGSLTALLAIFVFMALKRVVRVVLIRTISILTGHYIMSSFAKQYHRISIPPSQKGLEFPGGWGGSLRPKNLKNCLKFYWNFQRGEGRS